MTPRDIALSPASWSLLPAGTQAVLLPEFSDEELELLIQHFIAHDDYDVVAYLVRSQEGSLARSNRKYSERLIDLSRDWWRVNRYKLWRGEADSWTEYVEMKHREGESEVGLSVVESLVRIWQVYHEELQWSVEDMKRAGKAKLEKEAHLAKSHSIETPEGRRSHPALKKLMVSPEVSKNEVRPQFFDKIGEKPPEARVIEREELDETYWSFTRETGELRYWQGDRGKLIARFIDDPTYTPEVLSLLESAGVRIQ